VSTDDQHLAETSPDGSVFDETSAFDPVVVIARSLRTRTPEPVG